MSNIERYLKIRMEPRVIKGLKANYTGPKKLKKSGKAAGAKKKKPIAGKAKVSKKKVTKKISQAASEPSKNTSSRRVTGDGFNVIRKKK